MFKKTLTAVAAVAVTMGASLAVQAAEFKPGGYIQGSLGQARADKPSAIKNWQQDNHDIAAAIPTATSTSGSDRSDTAYKLVLGLQLSEHFAVEAQYLSLGKAKYQSTLVESSLPFEGKEDISLKTRGFGFNAVGSYPIGSSFAVKGRAGLHYLKTKGNLTQVVDGVTTKGSANISNLVPMLGLGATYNVTDNIALVGEYERYFGIADKSRAIYVGGPKASFKHDVDMFSAGIRYHF